MYSERNEKRAFWRKTAPPQNYLKKCYFKCGTKMSLCVFILLYMFSSIILKRKAKMKRKKMLRHPPPRKKKVKQKTKNFVKNNWSCCCLVFNFQIECVGDETRSVGFGRKHHPLKINSKFDFFPQNERGYGGGLLLYNVSSPNKQSVLVDFFFFFYNFFLRF